MSELRSPNAPRRPAHPTGTPPPHAGRDEAARVLTGIEATMEALLLLIEAETTLLRDGKTFAADELGARKSHYAKRYMDELAVLGAIGQSLEDLAPGQVERLRHRHEEFRSVLQINLAALATARAVLESGIRVVADTSPPARRPAPQADDVRPPQPRHARAAG